MYDPFLHFYFNVELSHPNAKMPTRATPGDAGLDLYTPIDFTVPARGSITSSLGFKYEMPRGFVLLVVEKSGVASKKKLDIGACVCDADYRGEVHINFFNNSDVAVVFEAGDKVAQGLIVPVWIGQPYPIKAVKNDTVRGEGGFGSTDK